MVELIEGVLDHGHSEWTKGKGIGAFREYASNRAITAKLKAMLEATGRFKITYSVNPAEKADKSLAGRAKAARDAGAAFFISVHSNAISNTAVRGTETFIHSNTAASVPFAQRIHENLVDALGTKDRGVKRANFGVLRETYQYMLSCLTEGEFFTNPTARQWMLTGDYETRYAKGVNDGLCDFYGVKAAPVKKPVTAVSKPIGTGGKLLEIITPGGELWVYNKPKFAARDHAVQTGEVFTIKRGPFNADGGKMYELISGLFITANKAHVKEAGKITAVEAKPKAKMIRLNVEQLWIYDEPRFAARSFVQNKANAAGEPYAFTIKKGPFKADGGEMYQLASGNYVTANPKYVTVI